MKEMVRGTIALTREEWGDQLWNTVGETLRILTGAGYQCAVRNDERAFDIIVIEYNYDSKLEYGDRIVLLDEEHYERYSSYDDDDIDE